MATQRAQGSQIVQIQDVSGSLIQITYDGQPRELPLERAVFRVGAGVRSPARLLRARSGVVPYAARERLASELESWALGEDAFGGLVIGGRGGSGKTRLGGELCERVRQRPGWVCGLLQRTADPAAMEALVQAPAPRLVVVDYAESRPEQLEVLVPLLHAHARPEHPVRIVLLVRARPRRGNDWTEPLRDRGEALDLALDEFQQRVLEDVPLELSERSAVFAAAADAFASRSDRPTQPPDPPAMLGEEAFRTPLLVLIAAYVAVHSAAQVPASAAELLDGLLTHEDHYWQVSAAGLDTDEELRARVVALATLASASSETEAVELLRLLPDLQDAPAERRGRLARWAAGLYPGPGWWNALEPDLLGERLVASCFSDRPTVLTGVLADPDPARLARSLTVYARAAADRAELARALQPILTTELQRLCTAAVDQAAGSSLLDLFGAKSATIAVALERALHTIRLDPGALQAAVDMMPPRNDLILAPLALTLTAQLADHHRELSADNPGAYQPDLAQSLHNLSRRLVHAGRREGWRPICRGNSSSAASAVCDYILLYAATTSCRSVVVVWSVRGAWPRRMRSICATALGVMVTPRQPRLESSRTAQISDSAEVSPGNRPMILVRRRTSTNVRSRRFVERVRLRCASGNRRCAASWSTCSSIVFIADGYAAR